MRPPKVLRWTILVTMEQLPVIRVAARAAWVAMRHGLAAHRDASAVLEGATPVFAS